MSRFLITLGVLSVSANTCIAQLRLIHGCGAYGCEPGNSGSTLLPLPYNKPDVLWSHSMARDRMDEGCGHHNMVPYTQGCISQESNILCSTPRFCINMDGQWAGHVGFSTDGNVLFYLNDSYSGSGFCGTDSSYSSVPGQSGIMSNAGDVILWSPHSVAYTSIGHTVWGVPIYPSVQCGIPNFVSEILGKPAPKAHVEPKREEECGSEPSDTCPHCFNTPEKEYLMLPADKMSHVSITNTSRVLFYVSTEGQIFGYATNAVPIAEIFLKSNSTRSKPSDLKRNGYPVFPTSSSSTSSSPSILQDIDHAKHSAEYQFESLHKNETPPFSDSDSVETYYPSTGTLVPIAEQVTTGSRTLYLARYYETTDKSKCAAPDGVRPCILPTSQLVLTAMDNAVDVTARFRLPWQKPIFDQHPTPESHPDQNTKAHARPSERAANQQDLNSLGPVLPLPKELETCVPAYAGYFAGIEPLVISGPLLLSDGATIVFGLSCVKKFQPPFVSQRKKYTIDDGRSFLLENSTYPDKKHSTSTFVYAYSVMEPHKNVPELLWMTRLDAAELRPFLNLPVESYTDIGPATSLTLDAGTYARLASWYNHETSLYVTSSSPSKTAFQASGTNPVPLLSGAFWITFPSTGLLVNLSDKGKVLHVASVRTLLQANAAAEHFASSTTSSAHPNSAPDAYKPSSANSSPAMRASRASPPAPDASLPPDSTSAPSSCRLAGLLGVPSGADSDYKDFDLVFSTRPLASPANPKFSAPNAEYYNYHAALKQQAEEEAKFGYGGDSFSFYENAPTPGMYEVDSSETVLVTSLLVVPKYCSSPACTAADSTCTATGGKSKASIHSKGSIHSSWIVGFGLDTHLQEGDDLSLHLSKTTSRLLWCVEVPSTDGTYEPEVATGQLGVVRHGYTRDRERNIEAEGQTRIVVGTRKGFVSLG